MVNQQFNCVYINQILFFFIPILILILERMEKEAEEERMRKQKAAAERAFQDGITKARLVMRRTPLGTDRNHNRLVLHIISISQLRAPACSALYN